MKTYVKPDIVDVFEKEGVEIRKVKTNNAWAICPFHAEKNPSLKINIERQVWFCYGCGKGGDVITFVRELHGLTFMQTLRYLGIDAQSDEEIERRQRERELKEMDRIRRLERHNELCLLHRALQKAKITAKTIEDVESLAEFYHAESIWLMEIEMLEDGFCLSNFTDKQNAYIYI